MKLGLYLVPATARRVADDIATHAVASRHIESISLDVELERLEESIATRIRKPWSALTPGERHAAVRPLIDALPPSRRGGLLRALAELFTECDDESAGLWIVQEPEDEEPDEDVPPEVSLRLLDELLEEQRMAKLHRGPQAGTEIVLRLIEAPPAAVTKAEKLAATSASMDAAEGALADAAVRVREATTEGEHETVQRLLALVTKQRAPHDLYTPAAARRLLAAIEDLQAVHGGEAKLAAALDEAMKNRWLFARDRPASVALAPLEWFKAALRSAVSHENGFAILWSTTML